MASIYHGQVSYQHQTCFLSAFLTGIELTLPHESLSFAWSEVLGAVEEPPLLHPVFSLLLYRQSHFQRLTFLCEDAKMWVAQVQTLLLERRSAESSERPPRKRYLVLINPASGKGQAIARWSQIYPFFEGCVLDIVVTQRSLQAMDVVRDYNLEGLTAILVVSGDGLMHEVINGLGKRFDWEKALKTPVFLLPGGSGNAFSASILYESQLPPTLENCAYLALKGEARPLDLIKVVFESGRTVYSFLSVTWSYIADVDVESEFLRFLGGWRFYIYGIWRLIRLKRYQGTVIYVDEGGLQRVQRGSFVYFAACNMPFLGESAFIAPRSRSDDGYSDLLLVNSSQAGRYRLARILLTEDSGNHLHYPELEYYKTRKWALLPDTRTGRICIDGEVRDT